MAGKQVKVNLSNIPDGTQVEVLYLGLFENGSTKEVADDQAALWEHQTGRKWPNDGTLVVELAPTDEAAPEAPTKKGAK